MIGPRAAESAPSQKKNVLRWLANALLLLNPATEWNRQQLGPSRTRSTRQGTLLTRACDPSLSDVAAPVSERLVLVFDTETTGVETDVARIVQLGAVYWRGDSKVGPRRTMLVDPGCEIPEEASAVHGITAENVTGAPDFKLVGEKLAKHLVGEVDPLNKGVGSSEVPLLCGYNALSYDVPLVLAEAQRHGVNLPIDIDRVIDPILWIRWYHRSWPKRNLEAVASHYGFELSNAHSAADDAEATGAVLSGLLRDGTIPDDLDLLLARQREIQVQLAEEWSEYGYVLYRDRALPWMNLTKERELMKIGDGDIASLRLGFGKKLGTPLGDVNRKYLEWILSSFDGLTEGARVAIEMALQ